MATLEETMDKHFAAAGIVEEKPEGQENNENNQQQQQAQEQNNAKEQTVGDIIAERNELNQDPDKKAAGEDQKQAPADKDKQGGGTDDKSKSGQEEKGQSAGNPNDLKLPDGTVVKAGAERRWYEDARTYKTQYQTTASQLNTVKQQLQSTNDKLARYEEAAKAVGVADPTEMNSALRLYRDLRQSPQETMKKLLVDLKAAGYSFDGIGATVDTAAIERIIDQKLPKTSVDDNKGNNEVDDEVAQEVATFIQNFPDAVMHEQQIAALIEAVPGTSLLDAYNSLKTQAIQQGFDWSKPLMPQIEARKASQQQQQQQQQTDQQKPLTNGADVGRVATGHDPNRIVKQADDFETAIREALKENGVN